MLNTNTINEIGNIVNLINDPNSSYEELKKLTEDTELLIKILSSVNKSNLKKYALSKTNKKVNSITDEISFTSEQVHTIFSSATYEEIQKKYNLQQLKAMYIAVCDTKPRSSLTKENIIKEIAGWFSYAKRNNAFAKL